MSYARGMMMLIAAGVAFYRGWKMLPTHSAFVAFGLGALALALAVWHLTRDAKSQRDVRVD